MQSKRIRKNVRFDRPCTVAPQPVWDHLNWRISSIIEEELYQSGQPALIRDVSWCQTNYEQRVTTPSQRGRARIWSDEEDLSLVEKYSAKVVETGTWCTNLHWLQISKNFPGKDQRKVQLRFYSILSKYKLSLKNNKEMSKN